MEEKERARALELTLGQIEKQFGKGSILRLGSKEAIVPVSVISTGSDCARCGVGYRRLTSRPRLRNLRPGVVGQNDHRACKWSRKRKRPAAWRRSLT